MAVEDALQASADLIDPTYGIIKDITVAQSLPDEPAIFTTKVKREHPDQLTDGYPLTPSEGGCALVQSQAVLSGIGEAVERYCACIYRNESLHQGTYQQLESALDPTRVTNFSTQQRRSETVPSPLYEHGAEIKWVKGERLEDGADVFVPAQLAFLNYDRGAEPFIRNPISTGLAAGMSRSAAIDRGALEVAERDAFMIYYLTKTKLPQIRLDTCTATDAIETLIERLERAGIDWHLLDARTDTGIPIVIAVLIADEVPAVTVSAAAHSTVTGAVQNALEEALQIRLYQRHLIEAGSEPVDLLAVDDEAIERDTRLLGWSREETAARLAFWTESPRSTTLSALRDAASTDDRRSAARIGETFDQYVVDLTTRDVSQAGFEVVRVIAPTAQPLYLREATPYLDTTRLQSVPDAQGYETALQNAGTLNDYPHPFS